MAQKQTWWSKLVLVVMAAAMMSPAFFSSGCAEATRISTIPEGGSVRVNGTYISNDPIVMFRYRSGLPETAYMEIEKPGYKKLTNVSIDKSLRADVSLLLLVLVFVPYFFSARFEDQYSFQLEVDPNYKGPLPTAQPAPPAPPPAPGEPAPGAPANPLK